MGKVVDYLDKYYNTETNYNCAEAVFCAAMEAWGVDMPPETVKAMAGFGGGMGCGNVCGAVTGGSAALSCRFVEGAGGHSSPALMKKVREYIRLVKTEYGSEQCKNLKPQFFNPDPEIRCRNTIEQVAKILDQVCEME